MNMFNMAYSNVYVRFPYYDENFLLFRKNTDKFSKIKPFLLYFFNNKVLFNVF